jgi:hypothetical protein
MIWVFIIAAVIVIWVVSAANNANSPQRQLASLQEWLNNYAESDYSKVQDKLRKDFQQRYDKKEHWGWSNEKEYNERRNQDRVEFKENELWRRHILTVMTSDKYSIDAKRHAAKAWHIYITTSQRMIDAIEIGYLDSDGMEELGRGVYESRSTLVGVMAAFDFNLEEETRNFEKEVAESFPIVSKKPRRATI